MIPREALRKFQAMTNRVSRSTTIALWVCTIFAIALFAGSFIVPPTGIIDSSVLRAASLVACFAGLFVLREAILEGLGVKVTHGDTTIEIKDMDGKSGAPAEKPESDG